MTATRREEIVALVHRWADFYNNDIERFAKEVYSPNVRVDVKNGIGFSGHDNFTEIEVAVDEMAPGRKMTIDRIFVDGDTAIVMVETEFPHDPSIPKVEICAILTFEQDKIIVDETYLDLRHWPTPKFTGEQWARLADRL